MFPLLRAQAALTENSCSIFHTHLAAHHPLNSNTPLCVALEGIRHIWYANTDAGNITVILDYCENALQGDWVGEGLIELDFCSLQMCEFLGIETLHIESRDSEVFGLTFQEVFNKVPHFTFYI